MTAGTGMRSEMTFNFGTKVHDRLDMKNYIVLKSGRGDWYVCIDRKLTQYKLNAVRIQIGWVKEDTPYKDPPRASKCDYKHSKKGVDVSGNGTGEMSTRSGRAVRSPRQKKPKGKEGTTDA
jgi:hypothetical protein